MNIAEKLKKIQSENNAPSLVKESVDKLNERLDKVAETPAENIVLGANNTVDVENKAPRQDTNQEEMKSLQVWVPMSIWKRMTVLKAKTGRKLKEIQIEAFDEYLKKMGE